MTAASAPAVPAALCAGCRARPVRVRRSGLCASCYARAIERRPWHEGLDAHARRMVRLLALTVCRAYNCSWGQVTGRSRGERACQARRWLVWLLQDGANLSLYQVCRITQRCHSNVHHILAEMRAESAQPGFARTQEKLARTFARLNRSYALVAEDLAWYDDAAFGLPAGAAAVSPLEKGA